MNRYLPTTPQALLCEPLMMDPRHVPALIDEARLIVANVSSERQAREIDLDEPTVDVSLYDPSGQQVMMDDGDAQHAPKSLIAVVPIQGVITRHGYVGWYASRPGSCEIGRHLQRLDRDESVGVIILFVNSPGGSVYGAPELSQTIYDIRAGDRTQIITCVDPLMASAGTYLGTAAEKVFAISSGDVGSIGVITSYTDYSKWLEEAGVKWEFFRIPEKKARFTGVEPMTDDMRQKVEQEIAESYSWFVRDMARNRKVSEKFVQEHFGGGELMSAQDGVDAKLIDGIQSLDDTIGQFALDAQKRRNNFRRRMIEQRLAAAGDDDEVRELEESVGITHAESQTQTATEPAGT